MSRLPDAPKLSAILSDLSDESDSIYMCKNVDKVNSPEVERDKQVFTDAVHYCMVLLRQSNRFTNKKSDVLSLEATLMGHEIFERIIGINVQMDVETEEEELAYCGNIQVKQEPESDYEETLSINEMDLLTTIKQEKEDDDTTPVTTPVKEQNEIKTRSKSMPNRVKKISTPMVVNIPRDTMEDFLRHSKTLSPEFSSTRQVENKQLPPSPESLSGSDYSIDNSHKRKSYKPIPLEVKRRVVELARLNPQWTLQKLRKEARVPSLQSTRYLNIWAEQVEDGGTIYDKRNTINTLTYERFLKARAKSQFTNIDMIRRLALKAAKDLFGPKFKFIPSSHWVTNFKKTYKLHWSTTNGYHVKNEKKAIQAAGLAGKKKKTSEASRRIPANEK